MSGPLLGVLVAVGQAIAQDSTPNVGANAPAPAPTVAEAIGGEVRTVFQNCQGAIVKVEADDEHGPLSGTGFFIDPNGTLYTTYTIGGDTRNIVVSVGNRHYRAERLLADARSGIAILKVKEPDGRDVDTSFLLRGKSRELELSSPVVAIGYPMDLPISPAPGWVAGFDLKYLGRYFVTTHIRANVPVQRGQGGAPLLNMRGEVVGICVSSVDQGSALFALPIEAAEKVRRDYARFGKVRPGWMGIRVGVAKEPVGGSTAAVIEVLEDAPGAKAGLEDGDTILELAGHRIRSAEDVLDSVFYITADDAFVMKVARGLEVESLTITPVERQLDSIAGIEPPGMPSDLSAPLRMRIDGK